MISQFSSDCVCFVFAFFHVSHAWFCFSFCSSVNLSSSACVALISFEIRWASPLLTVTKCVCVARSNRRASCSSLVCCASWLTFRRCSSIVMTRLVFSSSSFSRSSRLFCLSLIYCTPQRQKEAKGSSRGTCSGREGGRERGREGEGKKKKKERKYRQRSLVSKGIW